MEQQNMPVDYIDLQGKMVEPDKDNIQQPINRNTQLGNIKYKEAYWLQSLEEHSQNVENIPASLGGNIFRKWAYMARLKKHHFLVLTGSRYGFVRKLQRTEIHKAERKDTKEGAFNKIFASKHNKEEY